MCTLTFVPCTSLFQWSCILLTKPYSMLILKKDFIADKANCQHNINITNFPRTFLYLLVASIRHHTLNLIMQTIKPRHAHTNSNIHWFTIFHKIMNADNSTVQDMYLTCFNLQKCSLMNDVIYISCCEGICFPSTF